MTKIAIVAALEREVSPLVQDWRIVEQKYEGFTFKFFENGNGAVVVCGGIGGEAARRASEAAISIYKPEIVQSAGFAGALDSSLRVGEVFSPATVIDVKDGSRTKLSNGNGVLVSSSSVAGAEQKSKLAAAYGAKAVDMEAASVAKGARLHGIEFRAVKVISDEFDFEMSAMERFVGRDGTFQTGKFVLFAAVRPWLWSNVARLARNSAKAARPLSAELNRQLGSQARVAQELRSTLRV
jgi:adenosylhomocysteine nucleosidase